MGITFDKAFGIHQHTMQVRNKRAEVLAGNLANADTPGYKARDLDFKLALQQQAKVRELPTSQMELVKTSPRHMDLSDLPNDDPERTLKFRLPYQADTGNGNSVEVNAERMKYVDNTLQFQASMQFLNGRITTLMSAIKQAAQ